MSCGSAKCASSTLPHIDVRRPRTAQLRVPNPFAWLGPLARMHERWLQRQALLDLDDRMLRDVGISRAQALAEAQKWFWQ